MPPTTAATRLIAKKRNDGHITAPELPGIGFEGKSDLVKVMREQAE